MQKPDGGKQPPKKRSAQRLLIIVKTPVKVAGNWKALQLLLQTETVAKPDYLTTAYYIYIWQTKLDMPRQTLQRSALHVECHSPCFLVTCRQYHAQSPGSHTILAVGASWP